MNLSKHNETNTNEQMNWCDTKQLNLIQILLAVFLPSGFAFCGFRVVLPIVVERGVNELLAWSSIASIMLLIFVIVAFILIRKEAKAMNITIKERLCLRKLSKKEWLKYTVMLLVGLVLVASAGGLNNLLAKISFFEVPSYMPFMLDPAVDTANATSSSLVPGLDLAGAYWVLPLMAITLFLNILTEDIYFRAWLLPKMHQQKGKGVVLNAVLFAFYHSFQLWLLPQILISSLIFGFVTYKSKSIWPSFVFHMVFNTLNVVALVGLIFQ